MKNEIKTEIRTRAHLSGGLLNLLKDDVDNVRIDAENLDLFNISESIEEARNTIAKLDENLICLNDVVKEIKMYDSQK